jgi:hypothetical protein
MVALPFEIILLPGSKSDLASLNEFEPFTVSILFHVIGFEMKYPLSQ